MTIVIGLVVLSVVARDLRELASAARSVGNGDLSATFDVARGGEIGDLAKSFRAMQTRLLSDRLTGLANREAFLRRVEERLAQQQALAEPHPFAVLFIDLNDFKHINDNFGHDIGDKVLQEMAQRMLTGLRSRDMVARYAGDEFVVMLDAVRNRHDAESARSNLEQLLYAPLAAIDSVARGAAAGCCGRSGNVPGEWGGRRVPGSVCRCRHVPAQAGEKAGSRGMGRLGNREGMSCSLANPGGDPGLPCYAGMNQRCPLPPTSRKG
jgi:diguanylate cyclase (GGDEF)-like protein